jgi:hypothetical protein
MEYGMQTRLDVRMPWGVFAGGRVLCADGEIRALKRIAPTADTFFTVPASVTVKGKTVAGFVTVETLAGLCTPDPTDPPVVKFVAVQTGKNHAVLPSGAYRAARQN